MPSHLALACLLAAAACATPGTGPHPGPAPGSAAPAQERNVRVDGATALARALAEASPGTTLQLATGLYAGPLEVPAGVTVEGGQAVVLHAAAGDTTVTLGDGAQLRRLTVQGGDVGIRTRGDATLDQIHLSGQRVTAIHHAKGGLTATGLDLLGSISGTTGLQLGAGAAATLRRSRIRGAFKHGISAAAGTLDVSGAEFDGPVTAIHTEGTRLVVRDTSVRGGRAAGISLDGGDAELTRIHVLGHEYGLLAARTARLRVRDFTSIRVDRAGLALVEAKAELEDILVIESGTYGGMQFVGGEVSLHRFLIVRAKEWGVSVMGGDVRITEGVITRVEDTSGAMGEGLTFRRARGRVDSVTIQRTDGPGVLVAEGSRVALRDLLLEQNGWGGIFAETGGHVEAASLFVRGSKEAAIVVPGDATVKVMGLSSSKNAQGPVYAECTRGAEVRLAHVRASPEAEVPLSSPCIGRWEPARLFNPMAGP